MSKYVEYKIVNDEDLPPIVFSATEDGGISVMINNHHRLWLALNRNMIPSITETFAVKLQELTDALLKEQYIIERWD